MWCVCMISQGSEKIIERMMRMADANTGTSSGGNSFAGLVEMAWKSTCEASQVGWTAVDYREQFMIDLAQAIDLSNPVVANAAKKKAPQEVPPRIVARIIMRTQICRVIDRGEMNDFSGIVPEERLMPAIYLKDKGIYSVQKGLFRRLVGQIIQYVDESKVKQVMDEITGCAPIVHMTGRRAGEEFLVPLRNGIYDMKNKYLNQFSPDYVFLNKSPVAYNPNAKSPVLVDPETGFQFEFERWLSDIMDDCKEDVLAIKQILAACLMPNLPVEQMVLFCNEGGSAGKGCILRLIRALVGAGVQNMSIDDILKEYALKPLVDGGCTVLLGDENNTDAYYRGVSTLKALITGDGITVNMKNRDMQSICWNGTVVQCCNSLPRFSDNSSSFGRRIYALKFKKNFHQTGKVTAIKQHFLVNPQVLEYIVKELMENLEPFTEFVQTENSKEMSALIIENSDPMVEFFKKYLDNGNYCYKRMPVEWLYFLYKTEHAIYGGNRSSLMKSSSFKAEVRSYVEQHPECGFKFLEQAVLGKETIRDTKISEWGMFSYRGLKFSTAETYGVPGDVMHERIYDFRRSKKSTEKVH